MDEKKQFYVLKGLNFIQGITEDTEPAFVKDLLGRIVSNHRQPAQNYASIERGAEDPGFPSQTSKFHNITEKLSTARSTSLKILFENLVGISHKNEKSSWIDFTARNVTRHFLTDVEKTSRLVLSDKEVSAWLDNHLVKPDDRAYMIVGFLIADDVGINEKLGGLAKSGVHAKVPVAAIAAAASGVPPPGLDPGVEVGLYHKKVAGAEGDVKVNVKSVFAVEYKGLLKKKKDPSVNMTFGPQDPRSFAPKEKTDEEEQKAVVEMSEEPIVKVLWEAGHDDAEQEVLGENLSLVFEEDEEDEEDEDDEYDEDDNEDAGED